MIDALRPLGRFPFYLKTITEALRFRASLPRYRGRPLILVDRFAGMGDVVCTFPLLRALREKYPQAYIVFHTTEALREIVPLSGCVDQVVVDETFNEVPRAIRVRPINRRQFDLHFTPAHGNEPKARPEDREKHLVNAFLDQYGLTPAERSPRILLDQPRLERLKRDVAIARQGDGPVIMIHCGPTWPVRSWPDAHWERLVTLLRRELDATVIQLGADWHFDRPDDKAYRVSGAADWVGKLSLPDSVAAVAVSDLIIGLDSGLLHVAGAVGTPCVGIFGPTEPRFHLPLETPSVAVQADLPCLGCHHLPEPLHWRTGCPRQIACMRDVSPEQVVSAARRMLDRVRGTRTAERGFFSVPLLLHP